MNQDDSTKVFKYLYQNVTNFDSKEEFDRFYLRNKEEIDKMTTNSLNIKYKIKVFEIHFKKQNKLFQTIVFQKMDLTFDQKIF